MHLVSTNLVTWVQFLFAKNQSTEKSIAKYFDKKKKDLGKKILTNITTTISSIIDNSDEEDVDIRSRSIPANSRSLIFGLIFTIGTALSMIFFYVNWYHNEHLDAALNFNITDTVQNGIGIIACIFAFWRLRLLDFADHGAEHDPHHDIHANQLKSTDRDRHPGRQTITFLVILNMAMFIYQWFISDKAGTYEGVISLYGEESWAFFVSIFSPLTVFFRFHSSVCFVEIWKHTYAKPH
uniref:Uncharacterized protein n=1 Tax=Panagrolaimus sp. PS1159 TaxID=55785 RepID=A0AC35GJ44_9BILA